MHVHMYTAVVILDVGSEPRSFPDQELVADAWNFTYIHHIVLF